MRHVAFIGVEEVLLQIQNGRVGLNEDLLKYLKAVEVKDLFLFTSSMYLDPGLKNWTKENLRERLQEEKFTVHEIFQSKVKIDYGSSNFSESSCSYSKEFSLDTEHNKYLEETNKNMLGQFLANKKEKQSKNKGPDIFSSVIYCEIENAPGRVDIAEILRDNFDGCTAVKIKPSKEPQDYAKDFLLHYYEIRSLEQLASAKEETGAEYNSSMAEAFARFSAGSSGREANSKLQVVLKCVSMLEGSEVNFTPADIKSMNNGRLLKIIKLSQDLYSILKDQNGLGNFASPRSPRPLSGQSSSLSPPSSPESSSLSTSPSLPGSSISSSRPSYFGMTRSPSCGNIIRKNGASSVAISENNGPNSAKKPGSIVRSPSCGTISCNVTKGSYSSSSIKPNNFLTRVKVRRTSSKETLPIEPTSSPKPHD